MGRIKALFLLVVRTREAKVMSKTVGIVLLLVAVACVHGQGDGRYRPAKESSGNDGK